MEIIYPSLIEEAYRHSKKFHPEITKEAIYRHFYEAGLIKENGDPTEKALSEGVVKDYTEDWDLTFEAFLAIYPVFRSFDPKHFKKINYFWEMDLALQEKILDQWEQETFTEEEIIDLTAFFEERLPSEKEQ